MIVCICNALNEQAVRRAIHEGAKSADGVFLHHGCEPQCGKCVCEVRAMVRDGAGRPVLQTAAAR